MQHLWDPFLGLPILARFALCAVVALAFSGFAARGMVVALRQQPEMKTRLAGTAWFIAAVGALVTIVFVVGILRPALIPITAGRGGPALAEPAATKQRWLGLLTALSAFLLALQLALKLRRAPLA